MLVKGYCSKSKFYCHGNLTLKIIIKIFKKKYAILLLKNWYLNHTILKDKLNINNFND